jgi:hypothetical protein
MSKKNLFKGGAALLFIMILALAGCRGAGDPTPSPPSFSIERVALGTDMVIVTFNDTLTNIDKAKGAGYTTKAVNYTVTKKGDLAALPIGTVTPTEDKSVILAMTGIQDIVKTGATLEVSATDLGKLKEYTPENPKVVSTSATSETTIEIEFTDGVEITGTLIATHVPVTGATFTNPTVTVKASDPRFVVLTDATATGITATAKDIKISYVPDDTNKITGLTSLAAEAFKERLVDIKIKAPLTAKPSENSSATSLVLEFSEELYTDGIKVADKADVKTFFTATNVAAGDPGILLSDAVVGANFKTVTFTLANTEPKDTVGPNTTKTVTTQAGTAWKETFAWNGTKWEIPTPVTP